MMISTVVRRLAAALAGLILTGAAAPVLAQQPAPAASTHCSLVPLNPTDRGRQAALVVEGEVLSAESFWDARHQRIFTAHRLRVFSAFKGRPAPELTILTEGGTVGDDWQELTNTLSLNVGDQGVFFLHKAPWSVAANAAAWTAYASQQGFIRYDLTTLTAAEPFQEYPTLDAAFYTALSAQTGQLRREIAPNEKLRAAQLRAQSGSGAKGQAPVIALIAPLTLRAGTGDILTITGTGFGASQGGGYVEFRNADDGGSSYIRPQPADYVSWADGQIRVRVPSYGTGGNPAGTGVVRVTTNDQLQVNSLQSVVIPYALTNVQDRNSKVVVRPAHRNMNGSGGLTFQPESGFVANTNAALIFRRDLLEIWRCQTGVNWTVGATRAGRGAADDGENSIGFDSGNELPVNVLGRTTSYYRGCLGPRNEVIFYVKEIDMQFDDGVSFLFTSGTPASGQFDFESVLIHELGHAQQLSHVILNQAVMHFGVAPRQVRRSLSADDIAGGRLVLRTRSFTLAACGPAPMLPVPLTAQAASYVGGSVEVTWAAQAECSVPNFVVERAPDTTAWQTLATVPVGSSTAYRFVDPQPLSGLSYYRVRVRRPDGTLDAAYPMPVTAEQTAGLVVFPNPVRQGTLHLQFSSAAANVLAVYVYDEIGRLRRSQALDIQPGLNIRILPIDDLQPGWYVLRWRDQTGKTGVARFIKLSE